MALDVRKILALVLMTLVVGCGGLKRDRLVKHPEAPLMITGGHGTIELVIERPDGGFDVFGTYAVSDFNGYAVILYDWSRPIEE